MVTATFVSIDFAVFGSSEDRLIHATITKIKHTTKINVITIFVKAHIIVGNAVVVLVPSPLVFIQFQIIGKFVLSFIQLHSHAAFT